LPVEVSTGLGAEDLAAIDPAYWAASRRIRLVSGEFTFTDHAYQKEPMASTAKRLCYMKAT